MTAHQHGGPDEGVRLLLVRHGETPSNVRHVLDTAAPGASLTEHGSAQAARLATALAGAEIAAIYASTLVRTQQTAAPLAQSRGLPVHVRDGLREISAGELEMRGDHASIERYLATVFAWPEADLAPRLPGGEAGAAMLARFDGAVAGVVADLARGADGAAPTALLVSHGAAIRVWVAARTDNVDARFAAEHPLDNTDVVVVDGDPVAGWHVSSWASAGVTPSWSAPTRPARGGPPRRPPRPS
ncbi:histidine phosphatase family protein [Pengzhenrongella sicca]|uniref:Histidine phosphatase family protein n=1 Tax=Pengzhenrongella sicca TaxID=2819238 RepID=A0A8A4Z8S8_9MICO|nr:histidine phosphatase family protein [Pengzhenrongella sicca]QTE27875.1 histidine phosphatase family protein [Pengzhenrongella sicca]